ncbi:MAG: ABC transporter substrate-binding protein [Candidatus Brocadiales bacterium]|nr:ABC transporter substrate-binding protein [Candidatus Brocadiales bacterium]
MRHRKIVCIMFISIFAITANQSYLWSGEPGALVKEVIRNEYSFNNIEDIHERRARQWEVISPSLNFEIISQRVMGEYWEECLYEQKSGFVKLFTSHLKSSYIKKPNPIFGKQIISLKERQFNDFAKVQTILLAKFGKEISADFYLLRENGEWKICDLVVEGVSLVNNYHSQIVNTLDRSSYEELLSTIKKKQDEMYYSTERSILASDQSVELIE